MPNKMTSSCFTRYTVTIKQFTCQWRSICPFASPNFFGVVTNYVFASLLLKCPHDESQKSEAERRRAEGTARSENVALPLRTRDRTSRRNVPTGFRRCRSWTELELFVDRRFDKDVGPTGPCRPGALVAFVVKHSRPSRNSGKRPPRNSPLFKAFKEILRLSKTI